jgi:hypothetical protein
MALMATKVTKIQGLTKVFANKILFLTNIEGGKNPLAQ